MTNNRKRRGSELTTLHFLSLPIDIIFDILSRCSVEDIIRWRCASKAFYQVPMDPALAELQLERFASQPPCLLFSGSYHNPCWVYFEEGRCRTIQNQYKSIYACVQATCNGLLCLTDKLHANNRVVVIYNPFTNDGANLPISTFNPDLSSRVEFGFGFGYDSVHNKYKVVRVSNVHLDAITCKQFITVGEIITLGESSWRCLDFPCPVTSCGREIINTVFCNGAFYWLIHDENKCCSFKCILSFDIVNEKFHIINFSPSQLDVFHFPEILASLGMRHIRIFKFGECVGLVDAKLSTKKSLQIWKIVGNETSGYGLCGQTLDVSGIVKRVPMCLRLFGPWSDGCFSFTGLDYFKNDDGGPQSSGRIAFLNPETKEGFVQDVVGFSQAFQTFLFVPSLVSPALLIGSRGRDARRC